MFTVKCKCHSMWRAATVDRGFNYGWSYSLLVIVSLYWVSDTANKKPSAEGCTVRILPGQRLSKLRYFRGLYRTNGHGHFSPCFFWLHYLRSYNLLTTIVYVIHSFIKIKYNLIEYKAAVMPLLKFHSFWLCYVKLDDGYIFMFLQVLYSLMVLSFESM
jgi:hypothetical protein